MVKMTDGYGQRIGSIMWFRNCGQRKQGFYHLLDLKLFGIAVPDHGLFHESG